MREAPFTSVSAEKPTAEKCAFVRFISEFCELKIGGGHIDVLTGTLTHRFFGIRKVDPSKVGLATGISRFRDPFFERKKVTFFEKVKKVPKSQSFRSCVFLRKPIRRMDESSILMLLD